ncbi:spastin protein [Rutstroemia sp. NJR-2017a WRK4]|nr:spastin protein [Rutstroemia sp. NJR-2017a WRK4]
MGAMAKRKLRPRSKILGRTSKVTKSMCKMLVSPSRNPVRKQPLEAQIKFHNLPVKPRQLGRKLREHTKKGTRYLCAFIEKIITEKNHKDRNDKDGDNTDADLKDCVLKPDDITTTYDDVYISSDTIKALEDLTLSIQHPSSFTFGILSSHSPPGLLLYGSPGTGKSLIIGAFAKQAQLTFLALSETDFESALVDKGAKKIKRIFAYARKHHPCAVFIDRAGSIFRSRSVVGNSPSHLHNINSFLEEMGATTRSNTRNPMVIAATNKPFDIDDEVFRHLGRRIMVDTPDRAAREQILKIHLRGETIADEVLSELADTTPDYTGSELKDLVWTAAAIALRESALQKGKWKAPEGSENIYRVLYKAHFEEAKKQIRSSSRYTVEKLREFHFKFGNVVQRNTESDGGV